MYLTDHELTAASSVVAALAIIGGYLGVRSANQNALKIARDERSSRRKDEEWTYKRTMYSKCLSSLAALHDSVVSLGIAKNDPQIAEQRRSELVEQHKNAHLAIDTLLSDLVMIASDEVFLVAQQIVLPAAADGTPQEANMYPMSVALLEFYMKADLYA